MAQLDVHANGLASDAGEAPYLLLLQADLLRDLGTLVVAPLYPLEEFGPTITRLHPVLQIDDQRMVLSTAELAGISRHNLGPYITNLEPHRDAIFAAVDLLFFGI